MHIRHLIASAAALLVLALPAAAQTGDNSAVIDAVEARRASAASTFNGIVANFESFLASGPSEADASAARFAANDAINVERDVARSDIQTIAEPYASDPTVKNARNTARQAVADLANDAKQTVNAAYDSYEPGATTTTTSTTTTTTTPASTTTTTPASTTTTAPASTTTTAPASTTTTIAATTTTRATTTTTTTTIPAAQQEPPKRPPTFLAAGGEGGASPTEGVALITPKPRGDRRGIVLAWIQDDVSSRYVEVLLGPLVVVEAMIRALITAGRGLAAPASLLLSLVAALLIDRARIKAWFARDQAVAG